MFKLFAACNNDPDRVVTVLDHAWQYKLEFDVLNEWFNSCPCKEAFIRKFSATSESSQELEVSVEFEFMTKQEMADDDMSPNLDSIRISYHLSPSSCTCVYPYCNLREDIAACVEAAERDPERYIRPQVCTYRDHAILVW